MKLVNKIVFSAIAAALLFGTLSCSKKSANSEKKVKIGIAKIFWRNKVERISDLLMWWHGKIR